MFRVLVDAGPLVAILSPSDEFHRQCVDVLKSLAPPLYTCWPVLAEAAWLLRADPQAVETLLRGGAAGFYNTLALGGEDGEAIAGVLKRYRNLLARLADAALVHLAQRERIETIFTLDRRDFGVYRPGPNWVFQIIP
ncbi:MAG TPA: hypothetical protein VEV85_26425 [Bryobacteraceae bacterium]|nr:hypothetical protein [Bryobacteraceae bacterium]